MQKPGLRLVVPSYNPLDSDSASLLLLLDVSAASDTIDHSIVLSHLNNHIGIQGTLLSWFQSYLSNITQCVSYHYTISEISNVNFGIPQGSVFGPLLLFHQYASSWRNN